MLFVLDDLVTLSAAFVGSQGRTTNSNVTTYTFTGVSFGTPTFDRWLLIALTFSGASPGRTISMTVNGVSAAIFGVTAPVGGAGGANIQWFLIQETTLSSGDIAITANDVVNRLGVLVYAVTGAATGVSLKDQNSGTANTSGFYSGSVSMPAGSVAVGSSASFETTSGVPDVTWTGLAKDTSLQFDVGSAHLVLSGAHLATTAAQSLSFTTQETAVGPPHNGVTNVVVLGV